MQCYVHANLYDASGDMPYLLDIQADLLSDLKTRVVVPLVRAAAFGRRAKGLHPLLSVAGQDFVMATHLIAAVRDRELGEVVVLAMDERAMILSAIDVLSSGV